MFDVPSKVHRPASAAANHRSYSGTAASGAAITVSNQLLQHHLKSQRLRAKLAVGDVHDHEEAEADRTAEQIMSGKVGGCACGGTCASCRDNRDKVRRKPAQARAAQGAGVRGDAFGANSGRPLDAGTRRFFEPHFGDLSDVRVHDTEEAAATAAAIGARAYTAGSEIGFAPGEYAPGSSAGRKLLAHELAHVAQGGAVVRRQPDDETLPSPIVGAPRPTSLMLDPAQMCGPNGCFTDADIQALAETPSDPWAGGAPQAAPAEKQPDEEGDESEDLTSVQTVDIGPFLAVALTAKGPTPAPTPAPVPSNVARIVQGSNNPTVVQGTSMMAAETLHQPVTFGRGALAGADSVSIIAHGNVGHARIGTQAYSPRQLAEELVASGWKGGTVRLIICKTGVCGTAPHTFGQNLANELAALGADSAVIAPAGNVTIAKGIPGLPQVRTQGAPSPSPRGWDWEIYTAQPPKEPSFFSLKAWKGTGVGALKMGALFALSMLHGKAVVERMQKQTQQTGYAPLGPTGDKLYDLGAWFLDPTNDAGRSVPFSQRFQMAPWRQTIRDAADKKAVGDTYKFPWETDDGWDPLHEHRMTKTCYVYYRKGPNGYWYTIKGSCDEDDFFPPDLNKVIDPNVSDEELRQYLELPAASSGGDFGGAA